MVDCFKKTKNQRSYRQAYENKISIDDVVEKGNSSKVFLQKLYDDSTKSVYFDLLGIDKYGRTLGIIWFDEKNVNKILVQAGGCMIFKYNDESINPLDLP